MSTATSVTYHESLQHLKDKFFQETGKTETTTRELAVWAIRNRHWDAPEDLILKRCRQDFASALREEQIKDNNGRPIRVNQVARIISEGKQTYLWGDIRTMPRERLVSAVQLKREQIVGECRQIDRDCEYWNKKHPEEAPVQCLFDFMDDVVEGRFSGKFIPPRNPR